MIQLKSVKKSGGCEIYSIQRDGVEIGAVNRITINTDKPMWRRTVYKVFMGKSSKRFHPHLIFLSEPKPCKEFKTKEIHYVHNHRACNYESAWEPRKRLLAWLNDEFGGQS